jgi:cytochrome P450
MFEVLSHLTGPHSPDFVVQCVKDTGPVFRLSFPEITPFIMVCDPKLAREIYENEAEKPPVYKRGDGLTFGVSSILSKTTYGSDHYMVRKSLAPSFSLTNILSALPKLHEKIVLLKKIFLQNEKDNVSFNVSEIFPRLVMDMLCTAMFDVDYHTLEVEDGEGRLLLNDFNAAVNEMMVDRLINPLRFLMFWDSKYREGDQAAFRLYQNQRKLLENYRANNTPEEIEKSCSIMAHLIKTPYKSDKERCGDMTIFLTAGQDTTAYSIAWIMIEVAKHPHISEKIKAEIDSIVDKDSEHIDKQDLSRMVYLDYVIKVCCIDRIACSFLALMSFLTCLYFTYEG